MKALILNIIKPLDIIGFTFRQDFTGGIKMGSNLLLALVYQRTGIF